MWIAAILKALLIFHYVALWIPLQYLYTKLISAYISCVNVKDI
jgi:hypothetical protein